MSATPELDLVKTMRERISHALTTCHPREVSALRRRHEELDREANIMLGVTPCGDCPDPGPCDDTCPRGID